MLSPQLRRKVHDLWSLFWSSGLSNPLVAIEQITYLLFIRQLEALDRVRVAQGKNSIYELTPKEKTQRNNLLAEKRKSKKKFTDAELAEQITIPANFDKCRWSYIRQPTAISFKLLNETVFPWLRTLETRVGPAQNGNTTLGRISGRLSDAYFILDVNKTETLKRAVSLIDELFRALDTRSVNSDIMGDIFEYLLEEVKESGKNGQFRTPRHVIRFMVQLLNPELGKTILDPACGSGGFLLNTLLQWKADHTDKDVLRLEWDGTPHNILAPWAKGEEPDYNRLFYGYDNDRTMVRIAWMNLVLHGLQSPEIHQLDALSKQLDKLQAEGKAALEYDYILANPPFTGSVDEGDLSENKQRFPAAEKGTGPITTKSELLFVWLMLDLLKIGGRAAVIVPDGVLFGSTNAHRALRRQLLFENTLEAVVSLPANIFQPYSSVKTSILLFQKAAAPVTAGAEPRTCEVWFYEITDEAFSLDQRRRALYGEDNDLWDGLVKFDAWNRYRQGAIEGKKDKSFAALRAVATSKEYYQPAYWEERWRSVDDDFLKIFPEKSGDKGHTYPLHELWPKDFRFNPTAANGAGQYDEAVKVRIRPTFERVFQALVRNKAAHTYATETDATAEQVLTASTKYAKMLVNILTRHVRDSGLLDREFDQFGQTALRSVFKELEAKIPAWTNDVKAPAAKPKKKPPEPIPDTYAQELIPLLSEFAKLDGYNVWRRSNESKPRGGKLTESETGEFVRQPTLLSWIVPVRQWAERESWGKDPKTEELIEKPTHKNGLVDPAYLAWLRDTIKIYDDTDATIKPEHRDRLNPECLEFLDFNLSAGHHKPLVFEAGQHRPPSELIGELQALHSNVQTRLGKLLQLVKE
jgi:type I restriction enzyme M protein